MRRSSAALFLLLAFLFCLAGDAPARAVLQPENRVGLSGANPYIDAYGNGPFALQTQWEDTIALYDPATGVLFYVRQNPWTFFDPLGLAIGQSQGADSIGRAAPNTPERRAAMLRDFAPVLQKVVGVLQKWEDFGTNEAAAALDGRHPSTNEKMGFWRHAGAALAGGFFIISETVGGPVKKGGKELLEETAETIAKKADNVVKKKVNGGGGGGGGGSGDKPDFIVMENGTTIPVSQSQMREGFDKAGFPSRPSTKTPETGQIHTVPGKDGPMDVRTMEGSKHHPKRAVFTEPNSNNPVRPSGEKFGGNQSRQQRRQESHVEQKD